MTASKPLVLTGEQLSSAIPAVLQIGQAHFTSQCLYAVVQMGVPDIIGDGKLTVAQIAKELPSPPNQEALLRCMRLLSLSGVFEESSDPDGDFVFALTPTGGLLQTKAPQPSMACGVLHWMEKPAWNGWSAVPDFVAGATRADPFTTANGDQVFAYYAKNPESAKPFNEFMTFFSQGELPVITGSDVWKELAGKAVVDVGGNYGTVMGAVAANFPDVRCISFDLPEVIDSAGDAPKGVTFAKGDMFVASTIPKCEAIFMKHILHDWNDSDSERILKSCHEALPADGQVIIADSVLPDAGNVTPEAAPSLFLDAMMLVMGGKERTRGAWEALAKASGFKIKEIRHTGHPTCHLTILVKA